MGDAVAHAGVLEDARRLRFEHPIVRAAVETGLGAGERAALHRRAAELLASRGASAEQVALHLLPTEPAGDRWATEKLAEAAGRAVARGAPEAAVPLLRRALDEPPPEEAVPQLLSQLGRAESVLGDPAAAGHLHEAYLRAPDPIEGRRVDKGSYVCC